MHKDGLSILLFSQKKSREGIVHLPNRLPGRLPKAIGNRFLGLEPPDPKIFLNGLRSPFAALPVVEELCCYPRVSRGE